MLSRYRCQANKTPKKQKQHQTLPLQAKEKQKKKSRPQGHTPAKAALSDTTQKPLSNYFYIKAAPAVEHRAVMFDLMCHRGSEYALRRAPVYLAMPIYLA